MRSTAENEKIHRLAVALLEKRGIIAEAATYDQYAEAAEIAAECVAKDGENATVAQMLGRAAVGDDVTDVVTTGVLARFASDGKFVADLSVTEEEFLQAAIAAEQEREQTIIAEAREHAATHCPVCRAEWLDCEC